MRLSKFDIKIEDATKRKIRRTLMGVMVVVGAMGMTACSDDKGCTDSDVGADPAAPYDIGANQDPSDFGGDSDVGVGDPGGRGFNCADFD